ncbi:nascent polypeptide-associated complex protein [Candidatus Woesearchaeota archaeon CG_4_10_14_0_2_um_filter_57_5]|nr:MAG: nascent polypeptide-associated complex protein [Candidatus Woesearchaeota archaeon CG11_big_fil_rev_8_21_14_0_20_57_5]PIZ55818.1 MAG: nascent polypeptide-associated complex protein [Candidatus Woesearchaeota archaeon CG_4_10_14_0_2_um_filter_57_5]
MNKRQMEQAMRRLGIKQEELDAEQVVIRTADYDLVIDSPHVAKVNAMGQESYQITGDAVRVEREQPAVTIDADDIATVAAQAGVSEEEARAALEEAKGDLAAAILALQG